MLLVKTKIKESKIHGIGLFADQFIQKGTEVWRFTPGFDRHFTREQILDFPDLIQIFFCTYSSLSTKSNLYLLCADYGNFFNHSEDSNCLSQHVDGEEEVVTIAIRDIEKGEEITDNYSSFEDQKGKENLLYELAEKFQLKDEIDPRFKKIVINRA